MKCDKTECNEDATQRPVINVPAKGHGVSAENSIQVQIGLSLCLKHAQEVNPQEFVGKGKKLRKIVEAALAGKCPPNFKKAFVTSEGLDSERAINL